jgi:hypothetical protein
MSAFAVYTGSSNTDRLKPALLPERNQFFDQGFLEHGPIAGAAIFRHVIRISCSRDDASHSFVGEGEF